MDLGFSEILFLFLLALIIFGPRKLPEVGKQLGKAIAEFKRASRDFQMQIQDEVRQLEFEGPKQQTITPAAPVHAALAAPAEPANTMAPEVLPPEGKTEDA